MRMKSLFSLAGFLFSCVCGITAQATGVQGLSVKFEESDFSFKIENRSSIPIQQFKIVVETTCPTTPAAKDDLSPTGGPDIEFRCPALKETYNLNSGDLTVSSATRVLKLIPSRKVKEPSIFWPSRRARSDDPRRRSSDENALYVLKKVYLISPNGQRAVLSEGGIWLDFHSLDRISSKDFQLSQFKSYPQSYDKSKKLFSYIIFETPEMKIPIKTFASNELPENPFRKLNVSFSVSPLSYGKEDEFPAVTTFDIEKDVGLRWLNGEDRKNATLIISKRLHLVDGEREFNSDPILKIYFVLNADSFSNDPLYLSRASFQFSAASRDNMCPERGQHSRTQFCYKYNDAFKNNVWRLEAVEMR